MMKLFGNSLLLRPDAVDDTTTTSGIIVMAKSQKKSFTGVVLATGPGLRLDDGGTLPMEVTVGDRVLYNKFSARDVEVDDEQLVIIDEDDVLGFVDTEDDLGIQLKASYR